MKTISNIGDAISLMELLRSWREELTGWVEDGTARGLDLAHARHGVPGPLVEAILSLPADRAAVGGRLFTWDQLSLAIEEVADLDPDELECLANRDVSLNPLAKLIHCILAEDASCTRPQPPIGHPHYPHAA